ncbi:protein-serine O-palmitoleoyltransferase porcupine-like isoform X3 [Varroa jacobsoni]|uniref:protein-serine O-palmitoleoyltransferase porcupine-like isoform X3 n=1 Tax=Varroa jacobsoni TaxID=62625 RepID=UPI000BF53534|nr:protein-serine O-palmitoleoyltransferase porcupine-like isoform X3 [Varroa jacobsoni]
MDSELDYYGNLEEEDRETIENDMAYQLYGEPDEMYMSLADLWKYCMKGTLRDWFDITAYVVLSSCFLRWIASYPRVPRWLIHTVSFLLGLYCMVAVMDWHSFYAFTFGVISITTLYVAHWLFGKWRTTIVTLACLAMIIIVGEYKLAPPQWNRIRGTVMVMTMKIISLALDLDSGLVTRLPSLPQLFGFVFHCATIIFGPWISFYDYHRSLEGCESLEQGGFDLLDPLWFLSVIRALLLSTMCLVVSACGIHWHVFWSSRGVRRLVFGVSRRLGVSDVPLLCLLPRRKHRCCGRHTKTGEAPTRRTGPMEFGSCAACLYRVASFPCRGGCSVESAHAHLAQKLRV